MNPLSIGDLGLPPDAEPDVVALVTALVNRANAAEAALRLSQEQLRLLAWAVGHDMSEPLRSIVSYNQLLERRYKGRLDEEADQFIAQSVAAAQRIRDFLADVLGWTQAITDTSPAFGPVSMDAVFWAVTLTMDAAIRQKKATITHDPLPTVRGSETRLTQLLQALISNAIKFTGDAPPRVHVSASEGETEWTFTVADNGPGIEPAYFERIFEPFRRLHGREVPGSGLGLAVAKAVVEMHGGAIRVESEPGKGTRFVFTLAKKQSPPFTLGVL